MTAVVAQPLTGMALAAEDGYWLTEGWILLSIVLYLITEAFWLPVIWMQMRMRDLAAAAATIREPPPRSYYRSSGSGSPSAFPLSARCRRSSG
jgi:uncharacterized membrane protein